MKNADLIVEKNQSIKIAMEKILINDLRIVFVVENKKIIGSLSEGDILRSVFFKKNLENPVHIIMNKSFKFILETISASFFLTNLVLFLNSRASKMAWAVLKELNI